ncbi:hypothetical protein DOJ73_19430 [Salmonella enterica subsp. enterica]|nr:hypothetical protein [Salmonella enterica subsp. enterica]
MNYDLIDRNFNLTLLFNTVDGLNVKTVPLKSKSIKTIFEEQVDQFISTARPDLVNLLMTTEAKRIYVNSMEKNLSRLLPILLYICSDEPEIDNARQPGISPEHPQLVRTKKGYRLFPANGPRYWSGQSVNKSGSDWNDVPRASGDSRCIIIICVSVMAGTNL